MKTCPNCGRQLHELVAGCPECGARWNEDGTYAGVSDDIPVFSSSGRPETIAEMTPDQLRGMVFCQVFLGTVLAILAVVGVFWLIGLMLSAGLE